MTNSGSTRGLLSAEAVQASYTVGPDLPVAGGPTLTFSRDTANLILSWPSSAAGFAPYGSASLGADAAWTEVTGTITTGWNQFADQRSDLQWCSVYPPAKGESLV